MGQGTKVKGQESGGQTEGRRNMGQSGGGDRPSGKGQTTWRRDRENRIRI